MKIFLLLCSTILFSSLTLAQNNWLWQHPTPQGMSLNDVTFITPAVGWAVGSGGTIIQTTDGGNTWLSQKAELYPFYFSNLLSVSFTSNLIGVAVGILPWDDQIRIRTTNGGINWTVQDYGSGDQLKSIKFISDSVAYAVGTGFGNPGAIVKSTNGGATWEIQNSPAGYFLTDVYFTDINTGTAVGLAGTIIRTTDGGLNWFTQASGTSKDLLSVFLNDALKGYAVGKNGTILMTSDGGNAWINQSSGVTTDLKSIAFLNTTAGIASGKNGIILTTMNGGTTWALKQIQTEEDINSVTFLTNGCALAVGSHGLTIKSTDQGQSWNILSKALSLNKLNNVSFYNNYIGSAVGNSGTILKTTDGGVNWILNDSGTKITLNAISFADENTAFIVGGGFYSANSGIILSSRNSGLTWEKIFQNYNYCLSDVKMLNQTTGYISGYSLDHHGVMFKTTDGGYTWNTINHSFGDLFRLSFINLDFGFALGSSGIYKTTDGGNNWEDIFSIFQRDNFFFTDELHGTLLGANWDIRITANGGYTWNTTFQGVNQDFFGVSYADQNNGIVVGDQYNDVAGAYGIIFRTTNGGDGWNKEFSTGAVLHSVCHIGNTAYAVGEGGAILKMTGPAVTATSEGNVRNIPQQFALYPNYPNPFNPSTKIKYSIPVTQMVEIKIYDMLGREAAVLVNEILPPGTYEKDWNASGYAGGVYYYRLISGSYSQTNKMILLK